MPRGFISIGSNIDKEKNIPSSINALREEFGELIVSSVYETEPIGFEGENFYNLVVGFDSELPAKAVAKRLREIERRHGRTRECKKFSARTLDLDLLLYGGYVISDGRLQIPRDEITRYAFVLEPLAEIAPELRHPITHIKYSTLWEKFDKTDLRQKKIGAPEPVQS
ncbi:MAG: 2-amino-4-hydroxy-6-hydroxymethyldihydropteridine diphosphokinase [Gammaproteobacteria bacterium]